MKKVALLDCTLRDGGYINDWNFGEAAILDTIKKLEESKIDIIEIGFLKNEEYDKDRVVYNSVEQITKQILPKKKNLLYSAMIEVVNPLPLEYLDQCNDNTVDIIRVVVWKRMLKEGFEYCKGIVDKGYKICVQPARVDQYSFVEYQEMIELFNQLDPMAVYVVDSWGTQYTETLMKYIDIADKYLKEGIAIGYHGHNNLMQAFAVAAYFTNKDICRNKIIDASVYGIGRGAGNLTTELFAKYMNEVWQENYVLEPLISIYEKYVSPIYQEAKWGYSVPYYLTAMYNANPDFAVYYEEKNISPIDIQKVLQRIPQDDRIIFSAEKAEKYLAEYHSLK